MAVQRNGEVAFVEEEDAKELIFPKGTPFVFDKIFHYLNYSNLVPILEVVVCLFRTKSSQLSIHEKLLKPC